MTRPAWAALAILIASSALSAQQTAPFRSGVNAVYLDVTVIDSDGDVVTGLTKDDFEILDEGVAHDVAVFSAEPSPISVGVLIDTSRSMTGDRIVAALTAAAAVGRSLQPKDLWSVYAFNTHLHRIIGWRPYDASVEKELKDFSVSGGT